MPRPCTGSASSTAYEHAAADEAPDPVVPQHFRADHRLAVRPAARAVQRDAARPRPGTTDVAPLRDHRGEPATAPVARRPVGHTAPRNPRRAGPGALAKRLPTSPGTGPGEYRRQRRAGRPGWRPRRLPATAGAHPGPARGAHGRQRRLQRSLQWPAPAFAGPAATGAGRHQRSRDQRPPSCLPGRRPAWPGGRRHPADRFRHRPQHRPALRRADRNPGAGGGQDRRRRFRRDPADDQRRRGRPVDPAFRPDGRGPAAVSQDQRRRGAFRRAAPAGGTRQHRRRPGDLRQPGTH